MQTEFTLVILKPDTLLRGLVGKVISKFEEVGLKLVACKMVKAPREIVEKLYDTSNHEWVVALGNKTIIPFREEGLNLLEILGTEDPYEFGLKVIHQLREYMQLGPVIVQVWEGHNAVKIVRKLRGFTVPLSADPGTIIGSMSHDSTFLAPLKNRAVMNIFHASGDVEEANREIALWFGENFKPMEYDRADASFF